MNGEPQRLATHDDKPGNRAIFYVAHDDGVPNGYAENKPDQRGGALEGARAAFEPGSQNGAAGAGSRKATCWEN